MNAAEHGEVYHQRPLIFAMFMCCGTALYFSFPFEPALTAVLIGSGAALFMLRLSYHQSNALGILASIALVATACGIATAKTRLALSKQITGNYCFATQPTNRIALHCQNGRSL